MFNASKIQSFLTKSLLFFYAISASSPSSGKEGMRLPPDIKAHEKELKAMGLQIPADKLYNENGAGLNNAVVLFGRGCTGEIISPDGLLLTNHHCGYGSVQRLASAGKDYFENGFWARSCQEELPCPGLTVTFTRKMEDVTAAILKGLSDSLPETTRDSLIAIRIDSVEKAYKLKTHLDASIKPYYNGNQYWVSITETYRDIRLAGFPPNSIGAFGGDVENWAWPRHTGDFSIFRIYADSNNHPADYAEGNRPYHADQFFNINISGYKEGDFTMVYGFPGATHEYISSYELSQVSTIADPIAVAARTRKLSAWDKHMSGSRDLFLKYTSKRAGVANGWKKWQGEMEGLKSYKVIAKKQTYEKGFTQWMQSNLHRDYAHLVPKMKEAATSVDKLLYEEQHIKEEPLSVELIQQGAALEKLGAAFRLPLPETALRDTLKKLAEAMNGFFKNYDAVTDKDVFTTLMALYFTKCPTTLPGYYATQYRAHNQDLKAWAADIYGSSLLSSAEKLGAFAASATVGDSSRIWNDPAWQLFSSLDSVRKVKIAPRLNDYYSGMRRLNRIYMKAQMEKDKNKSFYPDANLTLRLSYGQVKGLDPDGPAPYSFQTHLREVVALDDPKSDIFKVPARLKQLYKDRDFGRWAVNGDVPVAFVATNHTTGGNSGSPVLNRRGELMGINFDRASEGVMSDYYFTDERCRNISVDIRYVLFIIEKFGNDGWLLDEMNLVKTK
jgi:hypothetical protein